MNRGPPYWDVIRTIPRLGNSTDKWLGAFKTNLQGKQDGSVGKGTAFTPHDLSFIPRTLRWKERTKPHELSSDFHMLAAAHKPIHTHSHKYIQVSVSPGHTVSWGLPHGTQLTLSRLWEPPQAKGLRSLKANLHSWMHKLKDWLKKAYLNLFYLCGGQRTSSGMSVYLPSRLQGTAVCQLPVTLWGSPVPAPHLTAALGLQVCTLWHTRVTSALPSEPSQLLVFNPNRNFRSHDTTGNSLTRYLWSNYC